MKKFLFFSLAVGMVLVFSGCNRAQKTDNVAAPAVPTGQNDQRGMNQEPAPVDELDFADPGSDEVGKEVQQLDDLINQTSPSSYDEDGLSEEMLDDEAELR